MTHKLAPFFQVKLGTSFEHRLTTYNTAGVWAREYTLLLTVATDENVDFHVSSCDLTPTRNYIGESRRQIGTVKVPLRDTLEEVLEVAVQQADPEFHKLYTEAV